jgi:hypothetical protein
MAYLLSHHKCATNWQVSYATDFARINELDFAATHESDSVPQADVVCLINASYPVITPLDPPKLHLIRNPLDLLVSAYHSHLRSHSTDGWPELARQREVLARATLEEGLFLTLAFLERTDFGSGALGPFHVLRAWDWEDPGIATLRMEDAVQAGGGRLGEWLLANTAGTKLPEPDAFSFESMAGRPAGSIDESSHYRSGKPGQWRDVMPSVLVAYLRIEFAAILERFYPESLA